MFIQTKMSPEVHVFVFHKHRLYSILDFANSQDFQSFDLKLCSRVFFIQIVVDSDFEDSFHMEMKWKIRKCCSAVFFFTNLMDIIKWNPMSIFLNVFIFIT